MVASYSPELVVYRDERSLTTPMLETVIRKSWGETVRLIRASTLATYSLVSSMRDPVGAFRLMVNCPASERGKNERPSKGNRPRLSTNAPISTATAAAGKRVARRTSFSYKSSSQLKPRLKPALKRAPQESFRPPVSPAWPCSP